MSARGTVLITVTLSVASWACTVPNRVYNPATNPTKGDRSIPTKADRSIVSVTPRPLSSSLEPDENDPECRPQGHACLAFLEYDDMGESWDRQQLPRAMALVERAKQISRHPIVVVFVHGWKNNASRESEHRNGNVNGFEGVLDYYRRRVYTDSPVVGIYVGWRGELVPSFWPVRRQFSYFNRERAAARIPGPSLTQALIQLASVTHRDSDGFALMIGHSFGALVLERALSQPMAEALSGNGSAEPPGGRWADLVVFVNSAAAAIEGKQMLDLLKNRYEFVAAGKARPMYLSVSSLGDAATRFAMPIGHGLPFLRYKSQGSFRSYTVADGEQPVGAQSDYFTRTLAHMQALQSHMIVEGLCSAQPGKPVPQQPPFKLPNQIVYQVCERPSRWNDTPYWAMEMPASLVRDHGSIFTDNFIGLLGKLMISPDELSKREMRPLLSRKK